MKIPIDIYIVMTLGGGLLIAAMTDLRKRKIPNLLTYPFISLALAYYGFIYGLTGLGFSAAGLGLGLFLGLVPYCLGYMGAGDVKLIGAVGACLGFKGVFVAWLCFSLIGGVYALLLYGFRNNSYLLFAAAKIESVIFRKHAAYGIAGGTKPDSSLPYGAVIALGTLLSIFYSIT